jgi:DNA-binding MarR family transcriptional regulator
LKKGTVALLQYLVHKSNKEQCFPAVETIASALGVCRRTVQYNMRKLEKAGYIIRKDRWYNHQQLTNQYVFNLGVTEDVHGTQRYSDAEKEMIAGCFNSIENTGNEMKEDGVQVEENQGGINKATEILRIYNMSLSGREKLLLIYLLHRADKKGLVYDVPDTYMNAIGVGQATFVKLLKKLQARKLIRVRLAGISGRKLLLVKLTNEIQVQEEASADCDTQVFVQIPQKAVVKQKSPRIVAWKKLFKACMPCRDWMRKFLKKVRIILRL